MTSQSLLMLSAMLEMESEFLEECVRHGFIRLEGGAAVAFKTSWAANVPKNTGGTMILGTEGGLTMDPLTLVSNMGSYQVNIEPQVPGEEHGPFSGHWGLTAHMVRVIRGQQKLIVRKEEVLNVMRTLDLLYQSAAEGREVSAPKE